jgi:hypothetical protein
MTKNKRIWGTEQRPYTSYTCGELHEFYEKLGKVLINKSEDGEKICLEKTIRST